ncbi:MAG: heme exporter protein CcmD [Burkholderiales bacterium]|jgi:heme exporter protein D|nr:heme exporter protein CcmD [Burkholderiales bacterium]
MNWNSVSEFIQMGGYGLYVWGSYSMVAAVMVLEVWQLRSRARAQDAASLLTQDGENV